MAYELQGLCQKQVTPIEGFTLKTPTYLKTTRQKIPIYPLGAPEKKGYFRININKS